ncbi:hypothetical protein QI30_17375 [Kurthia sp. 3B1D]|uniref:DAGKc domain-containing protein n=1 Tax=Candidatus Kurthia intestinigallinarum TaxID=1562256 RepID=A0A433RQA5_9BACL|nr:diacylglycerol kinase family protein [Kurthia sp. 3B1D]RUS52527.1 hypothetical protein QI30_17375 [Kurthia sp. 3B1D]
MEKAMIIINPTSGKEQGTSCIEQLKKQLAHYEVTVCETQKEGDATDFAKEACKQQLDLVVLVGGDGTVHEGINGLAEQTYRPKVGVVPLGTVNDFARALSIPLDVEGAIACIGGPSVEVDIGKLNGRYFTNVVAIGSLPDSVGNVSSEQKSMLGSLAYAWEGTKAAFQHETYSFDIDADGQQFSEESLLVLVALTNSVGGMSTIADQAAVDDGYLHGFVVKSGSVLTIAKLMTKIAAGTFRDDKDVHAFRAHQMTINGPSDIQLNVDGDMMEHLPAHFSILPKHITVYGKRQ